MGVTAAYKDLCRMKNQSPIARLLVVASIALSVAGCGEKTTSTSQVNPDGTQTTTVTEKKGFDTKTTVTQTPAPDQDADSSDPKSPQKIDINLSAGRDTADGADKVHVRGPGIKIDANDSADTVDIKLPFVKVKKDGDGHVHVKTPFVNIESNEN
jgi:hypothetical protein